MRTASFQKLRASADHLADAWDRILFSHVCLEGLLSDSEMAQLLTPSYAAHVRNRLIDTLVFDLIRDIGAAILDNRRDAMSLRRMITTLKDRRVAAELLAEYTVEPAPLRNVGNPLEPEMEREVQRRWRERELVRARNEYDRLLPAVLAYVSLLDSPIANALEDARNKGVAHYGIVQDGNDWRVWRLPEAKLTFHQLAEFIKACSVAVDQTRLLVLRASGSFDDARTIYEKYFADFAETLRIGLRQQREREHARLRGTPPDRTA